MYSCCCIISITQLDHHFRPCYLALEFGHPRARLGPSVFHQDTLLSQPVFARKDNVPEFNMHRFHSLIHFVSNSSASSQPVL